MKTIIELQAFGDFDVLYTKCIMVSPELFNQTELMKEFCDVMGIQSTHGLSNEMLRTINDDFISFLEMKGFKELKTRCVFFCD